MGGFCIDHLMGGLMNELLGGCIVWNIVFD